MNSNQSCMLLYGDEQVPCTAGQTVLSALLAASIDHRHICGGRAFCTSCRIEVLSGSENLGTVSQLECERLGPTAGRLRLACQTRIWGDVHVRVPPPVSSRFSPDDVT